jgi:hypothetical protein
MAKKTAEKKVEVETGGLRIAPIKKLHVGLRIIGTSPLIQHNWDEKSKRQMREKHAGKKSKTREVRDPQAEAEAACYLTGDDKHGVPAMAIKKAILTAAHKDLGLARTTVQKALFLICPDDKILHMDCNEPEMREDTVRVGNNSTDLRYRPCFTRWSVDVEFEIDNELLQVEDLLNLIDRAGFGVGIGEWRPEKSGEYGRFEVDRTHKISERLAD